MKWKNLQNLPENKFRRITGVKYKILEKNDRNCSFCRQKKNAKGGRPNDLCIEERILMTLEYLREYRIYAHIGASYGLAESNAYQNIRWIENVLIKSKEFRLPGKKALLKSDHEFEVILIDATESPIERTKKNNDSFIQAKKSDIRKKHSKTSYLYRFF